MSDTAHVTSVDAIRHFAGAVIQFQEEARLCLAALDVQLRHVLGWLERDRPTFWKREIENCMRDASEARIRLHQCRMRRFGDFRPSCIEEQKALEKAKRDLEHAYKQVPHVKHWYVASLHEANEYRGRAAQMLQVVEREVPRLLAILRFTVDRLDAYASVTTPGDAQATARHLTQLVSDVEAMLARMKTADPPATSASPGASPADVSKDGPATT